SYADEGCSFLLSRRVRERLEKSADDRHPFAPTLFDITKLLLHPRRELDVDDYGEMLDQPAVHRLAQLGGEQPALFLPDIVAGLNHPGRGGVRALPPPP